jgi:hypothetical protein
MIRRLLLAAWLAAAPLQAQLTFSIVQDSADSPIDAQVRLPQAAAGDTLDALFRVRNTGASATSLTKLSIAGSGFSLLNLPAMPAALTPGEFQSFTVRFHPDLPGMYSALLRTDGFTVFVLATAAPALTIYVDDNGTRRQLDPITPLDFGTVERGSQRVRHLTFVNQTQQSLVSTLAIIGKAFRLPAGAGVVALDPQASVSVDLVFAPTMAGPQQAELDVDQRRFSLLGSTMEPPLPPPIITVDLSGQPPASGLQPSVAVRFDPPPGTSGSGKLRLDFQPSVDAPDDPAIQFLPTGSRSIDFEVIEGISDAQFGPTAAIPFQTGTTAGTIILTAELGGTTETLHLEIPPQPPSIDSVVLTRNDTGIQVQVSGYDNTRSISQATFTFLQKDGSVIPPGGIRQDVSAFFRSYFGGSTQGGGFQMNATFPAGGGAAGAVDRVQVLLTNSVGRTAWPAGN